MGERKQTDPLINRLTTTLCRLPGVVELVLRGSRATGNARENSDVDIVLYYETAASVMAMQAEHLDKTLAMLDDEHRAGLLHPPGSISRPDGGAGMVMEGLPVDLHLREWRQMQHLAEACLSGNFTISWRSGHPFGLPCTRMLAELATCRVLFETDGIVSRFKTRLSPYPEPLRTQLASHWLQEAEAALRCGRAGAEARDIPYAAAALAGVVHALSQMLFAINRIWNTREKGCFERAVRLPIVPSRFASVCLSAMKCMAAGIGENEDGNGNREHTWQSAASHAFDEMEHLQSSMRHMTLHGTSPSAGPLVTDRLRLVPLDDAMSRNLVESDGKWLQQFGMHVSSSWPTAETRDLLATMRTAFPTDGPPDGFGVWALVRREDGLVIGDAGFKGPPDVEGRIEIGFGLIPEAWGSGYAREAVKALLQWADAHPFVKCVEAECLLENERSAHVLKACGFLLTGEDGICYRWIHPLKTFHHAPHDGNNQ